ncbi:MAG: CU044_2847 family protein [Xenococcus sp. MO_188.B8]|nr:CU044_2847 family protein [Xenococcus sp. MO_188.B8]
MSKLTEILAPDGSKIYIQYDEEESDELEAVGFIDDIAERTEKFKEATTSTIKGYAATVLGAVKTSLTGDQAPDKIQLEFGLQAGGETGVPFVTKGTAQANVKVTIEWDLGKKNSI